MGNSAVTFRVQTLGVSNRLRRTTMSVGVRSVTQAAQELLIPGLPRRRAEGALTLLWIA